MEKSLQDIQRDMETLSFVMSRCTDDAAYRIYSKRYDALVAQLRELENREKKKKGELCE